MAVDILAEITAVRQELTLVATRVHALQSRLDNLDLQATTGGNGRARRLVDLEGIWQDEDFSWEEIKASEYHLPVDLL